MLGRRRRSLRPRLQAPKRTITVVEFMALRRIQLHILRRVRRSWRPDRTRCQYPLLFERAASYVRSNPEEPSPETSSRRAGPSGYGLPVATCREPSPVRLVATSCLSTAGIGFRLRLSWKLRGGLITDASLAVLVREDTATLRGGCRSHLGYGERDTALAAGERITLIAVPQPLVGFIAIPKCAPKGAAHRRSERTGSTRSRTKYAGVRNRGCIPWRA